MENPGEIVEIESRSSRAAESKEAGKGPQAESAEAQPRNIGFEARKGVETPSAASNPGRVAAIASCSEAWDVEEELEEGDGVPEVLTALDLTGAGLYVGAQCLKVNKARKRGTKWLIRVPTAHGAGEAIIPEDEQGLSPCFRKIKHSCCANCQLTREAGTVVMHFLRSLRQGEEITLDFSMGGRRPLMERPKTCGGRACVCTSLASAPSKARRRVRVWNMSPPERDIGNPALLTLQKRAFSLTEAALKTARGEIRAGTDKPWTIVTETLSEDEILEQLQCLKGPREVSERQRCLSGTIMNEWLRQWCAANGFSFGKRAREGSSVWVAQTEMFDLLIGKGSDAGYRYDNADSIHCGPELAKLDDTGQLATKLLIIPTYIPPAAGGKIGHWRLRAIKTRKRELLWGDSLGWEGEREARLLGRWWDDTCTRYLGWHQGSQEWACRKLDIGKQCNSCDCGVYTLNAVACLTAHTEVLVLTIGRVRPKIQQRFNDC